MNRIELKRDLSPEVEELIKLFCTLSERRYYGQLVTTWHDGKPLLTEKTDKIKHGGKLSGGQ